MITSQYSYSIGEPYLERERERRERKERERERGRENIVN
jgi:hypothetical protein